jgi:hypothetical protein
MVLQNMINLFLIAGLLISFGSHRDPAQNVKPPANEWKGLVPLRSNRSDVERVLGSPAMPPTAFEIYKTETERVDVLYSAGPCSSSHSANWDVAKDVVISLNVIPQKSTSIRSLSLDPKKYSRIRESHPENWFQYWNRREGVIVHSILQGKMEYLYFIEYGPSAQDEALRCTAK